MKEYFENLLTTLEHLPGGKLSSKTHLKMALYDWNVERNWNTTNSFIIHDNKKGFAFFQITKKDPRHCTLRHIFVLEEYRKQGVGINLVNKVYETMRDNDVNVIRFYANLPAKLFYEKLGYQWLGESKNGLPFTYTDIDTMEPIYNEKQVKKLYNYYGL
jgi:GNAT superfamily N-acetyltransferase